MIICGRVELWKLTLVWLLAVSKTSIIVGEATKKKMTRKPAQSSALVSFPCNIIYRKDRVFSQEYHIKRKSLTFKVRTIPL